MQSLPPSDLRTGARIREDIEALNAFHQHKLGVSFLEVRDSNELWSCLASLLAETKAKGEYPILHIESHGSDDTKGLILADGSFVGWMELRPVLTAINQASRCNLVIVLAACYGAHLTQSLVPTDRSPCWGLIGPTDRVSPTDLLGTFGAFYTTLLSTLDGNLALSALVQAPERKLNYYFTSCEAFFKLAYAGYLATHCSPEALAGRARRMSRKLRRMESFARPGPGAIRRMLKRTEQPQFEKYKQQFFMIDLFPENAQRFPFTFEEVTAESRTFGVRATGSGNDSRRNGRTVRA